MLRRLFAFTLPLVALSGAPVLAQVDAQTVQDFALAQAAIYNDPSSANVERFVAFMTEDIKDVHVAYGREFTGKDHFRRNMPNKAKALLSYERQILQVLVGSNVAVVVYREQSKEKKSDGEIRDYSGRTIMVLDVNDDGLITQMRRYQD